MIKKTSVKYFHRRADSPKYKKIALWGIAHLVRRVLQCDWKTFKGVNNKSRHNWVGKVIHKEICKKFKFDHTNKWYLHNPASVPENDTHKLPWDFDIQTDHLISTRRPDLIIINNNNNNKKNLQNCGICCHSWPPNKTERMWKEVPRPC